MGPFDLTWVLNQVGAWFDRLSKRKQQLVQEERAAIKCYLDALTRTRNYLGRILEDDGIRKREEEEQLAQAWTDAAGAVNSLNPQLADACLMKSKYWSTPEEWRQYIDASELAIIDIGRMSAQAQQLLGRENESHTRKRVRPGRAT